LDKTNVISIQLPLTPKIFMDKIITEIFFCNMLEKFTIQIFNNYDIIYSTKRYNIELLLEF